MVVDDYLDHRIAYNSDNENWQKDLYLKYKNETFTKDDYDFIANCLDEFVLGCCPEINYL